MQSAVKAGNGRQNCGSRKVMLAREKWQNPHQSDRMGDEVTCRRSSKQVGRVSVTLFDVMNDHLDAGLS